MAKVSENARKKYFDLITPYRREITKISEKEKRIEETLNKSEETGKEYKRLSLAEDSLFAASYHMLTNTLSVSLLGIKNESALTEARRSCYKAIIHLEKVFSNLLDVPFQSYEALLANTTSYPEMDRYALIRKMGFAISQLEQGFGENSRWRWSILDLNARLATVAKNNLDLKKIIGKLDIRNSDYRQHMDFLKLSRRLLQEAADGYRLKYEISTNRMDDFRLAINYLSALNRLLLLLGLHKESKELKRKIVIWKDKMESDEGKE